MAGRRANEEVLNARIASAKARLEALAAEVDARPSMAERAFDLVRRRPWQGVGLALVAGVVLGAGRGRALRALAPSAAPLLADVARTALRGADATSGARDARAARWRGRGGRRRS